MVRSRRYPCGPGGGDPAYAAAVSAAPNVLQLSIEVLDESRPDYPVVTILIDGADVLGALNGGFIGFDPSEILDTGALLPADPPERVAVYRCSCGVAGCGCVALIIERDGDRIRWSDLRDYTGVYDVPLGKPAPPGGSPLTARCFEFDAVQYDAELHRASADRSWETVPRLTARLLHELLTEHDDSLAESGYHRGWLAPHWDAPGRYMVEFVGPSGQLLIELAPTEQTPESRAAEMAHFIATTDPSRWNAAHRHTWPADQIADAVAVRRRSRWRRRTTS